MNWKAIVLIVIGCALAGMVLGGLFGFASGSMTPDFFARVILWEDIEPVGAATFFGATAGVLLSRGLGCFAIIVQVIFQYINRTKEELSQ
ncbi:MAG: hypothetical protein WEB58_15310 [Planctomycetaceae bacterium]